MGLSKTCMTNEKAGVYSAHFIYDGQSLSRPGKYPLGVFLLAPQHELARESGPVPVCSNTFDLWPDQPIAEAWYSNRPVSYSQEDDMTLAWDGETLMGALSIEDASGDLEPIACKAYGQIFDKIQELNYPYLFRMWNYFPEINEIDHNGLERYRAFCKGRAEAFFDGRHFEESYLPAGTGIGSRSGPLTVAFMASRGENRINLENPRQMPAYHYPHNYGPRSPSFARGTIIQRSGGAGEFYVSGTASIVGHETVYIDQLEEQIDTAFENIALLLDAKNLAAYGQDMGFSTRDLDQVRIYIRFPRQYDRILRHCRKHLREEVELVCLGADICRRELLVEIEGVVFLENGKARHVRSDEC